ncbi:Carn_acyltransf domain-containing protein [Meloidogyne graminicola]|uniref:Carn_acyltransf domain-containing protein n=1 Tax=Meloidogyne graminicola TaxID=189291 RepID=A0A8S9ZZX1_9BILA|nr:Carn_acyltransf domain-containing protein [Meloidogyne graminicola]
MPISQLYKKILTTIMPCSTSSPSFIPPINQIIRSNATIQNNLINNNTSLPKLPLPQLEHTIEKFLKFSKAIQDPKDYGETLIIANKFLQSNESKQLQMKLEIRAQKLPNWLTPWWLNIAYLAARTPLPIITSPGVTFPYFNFNGIEGQINYAARIIQSAVKFHHKILGNELTPDKGHGHVLFDMEQYKLYSALPEFQKLEWMKFIMEKIKKNGQNIFWLSEMDIFTKCLFMIMNLKYLALTN